MYSHLTLFYVQYDETSTECASDSIISCEISEFMCRIIYPTGTIILLALFIILLTFSFVGPLPLLLSPCAFRLSARDTSVSDWHISGALFCLTPLWVFVQRLIQQTQFMCDLCNISSLHGADKVCFTGQVSHSS